MKVTKKERKQKLALSRQKAIVTKLEVYNIENVAPVICPIEHFFADGVVARKMTMKKDTYITGIEYKKSIFWLLTKGSLRLIEGDHTRDIVAPQLMKNMVGTKNAWLAFDDCEIYGFIPSESTNIIEIMNSVSAVPAEEIQCLGANKQQLNFAKRIANEHKNI